MSKWIPEVESKNGLLYFLETNLSMSNPAAGEDGEVQFNGGGVLDADSKFIWDGDRERLLVDGHISGSTMLMAGAESLFAGDVLITGSVGIGTTGPATALDIHHDPTGLSDNTGGGEVVTFGTEDGTDALAAGKLMYLNSSGVWKYTDADATGTSGGVLLAIALGTAVSDGLLIRGFFDAATLGDSSSFVKGGACYVGLDSGTISFTAPSSTGDIVRVVGYGTDTANVIYFSPDGTYIEIT